MRTSLVLFVLFAITIGFVGFKEVGGIVGGILAILYLVFTYFLGPTMVLMFTPIKSGFKSLDIVEKLSPEIKDFNPEFYIVDSPKIVIFSLPAKKICLSQSVLEKLNKAELESIIMGEIIRIKNGENLQTFFLKAICGPFYILFMQNTDLAIDYETAKLIGDPEVLAAALEKLYGLSERTQELRKL